ncbi:MAG: ABC transporter permease [Acidobacteriota bacterium]|nr:ABC transporter permease [Acidobacteriota bacterium]
MRRGLAWHRVTAVARKDAAELARNPGAILPAIAMVFGSLFPAFLVVIGAPLIAGESLGHSGEFADEARAAIGTIPEIAHLTGDGLIQAFLFHQFTLLLLLVPVVAAMALATHAVIGEKQSKSLEPLLATPLSTVELLAAKTLTPFVFSLGLSWAAVLLYMAGIFLVAEPGVWRTMLGPRSFLLFVVLGPLVALASLQLSVIVSSRAADARSAQQLTSLVILPITIVFVAQLMGAYVIGPTALMLGSLGCGGLNVVLLWTGVRVFDRESILMRWK